MNRIPSANLSKNPVAATINKKLAFLNNAFHGYRFMQRQGEQRGTLTTMKGGEEGTVIEQITEQEKFLVTLIRRMEVKQ